jgi:pre-mRNA-processing factor SLU7
MTKELRIREDTAKYLLNLDPNSAAYSGKSRTMNDNPNPDLPGFKATF